LLDVHPDKGKVAITLGLCPRLSSSSAGDHRPMRDGQGAWLISGRPSVTLREQGGSKNVIQMQAV
jgi:hypothetical protein